MFEFFLCFLFLPSQEMCTIEEPNEEFTSRHSLEWKFLFLDHRYNLYFNVFLLSDADLLQHCLCSLFSSFQRIILLKTQLQLICISLVQILSTTGAILMKFSHHSVTITTTASSRKEHFSFCALNLFVAV